MTSQIVANIDSDLKKQAMEMAKKNWITLKSLISLLLKSYVEKDIKLWARMQRNYSIFSSEKEVEDIKVSHKVQKKMNELSDLI